MKKVTLKKLDSVQARLLNEASQVKENAYNPYSHFYVGAAVLSARGEIISAANVENASFGNTICAERSALTKAVSERKIKLTKIAIIARPEKGKTKKVTAPCGACRQSLFEFSQVSGVDIEVIMSNTDMSEIVIAKISELLPMAFGPNDLKK